MRHIVVHVGSLVLRGFGYADRRAIAEGLSQELAAALSVPHVADRVVASGGADRLRAAPIRIDAAAAPDGVGRLAGRSIAAGVAR